MKIVIDSCIFIEIILHQEKEDECTKKLYEYPGSDLFVTSKIIKEVSCRIDEEVFKNFEDKIRNYLREEILLKDMKMMREEFYSIFESWLEKCNLIHLNNDCEDLEKIKGKINGIRFDTVKSDSDKNNLLISISQGIDLFLTKDGPIGKAKNSIQKISNRKLQIECI